MSKNQEIPTGVDPKQFELAKAAATAFITHMITMSPAVQLMAADMAFKAIVIESIKAPKRLEIYDRLAAAARVEVKASTREKRNGKA